MDSTTHILDVAISALQHEYWFGKRQPPLNILALSEWIKARSLSEDQMIDVFNARTPGLVASMQDVEGNFWEELWKRIDARIARGN